MLKVERVRSDTQIEAQYFRQIVESLNRSGWTPLIRSAEEGLVRAAGLDPRKVSRTFRAGRTSDRTGIGEVFVREGDLLYITSGGVTTEFTMTVGGDVIPRSNPATEMAIISSSGEAAEGTLSDVCAAVEAGLKGAIGDGRKTRHLAMNWQPVAQKTTRLARIIGSDGEAGAAFRRPDMSLPHIGGADLLASRRNRSVLVEISEAVFVRERDFLLRRKDPEADNAALTELAAAGLVEERIVVQCRKTSTPLTVLPSLDALANPAVGMLPCAACGRLFSEELASKGYSPSKLGKELIDGSYWMTVWVTDKLLALGISPDVLLWNVNDSGEEVDILAEVYGQLWIFELKDRDFGPGDAHPFNYRKVRYSATRAIIVTTETVSKDARQVFTDLARDAASNRPFGTPGATNTPIYIEGLDEVRAALEKELTRASFTQVSMRLAQLGEAVGVDLPALARTVFASEGL